MRFRVAITETTRQYYQIDAADKAEAQAIVKKLNDEELDIDDIGDYDGDHINETSNFELTDWREETE